MASENFAFSLAIELGLHYLCRLKMRILIINHSDTTGGAAIAMSRLMNALQEAGHDVFMLVTKRGSTRDDVALLGSAWSRWTNRAIERAQVLAKIGLKRDLLFSIDPATRGHDVASHERVAWADVIMLGWINQGTLSLDGIDRLLAVGKPVIWVMHDMWNMTGVCHVTGSCTRYTGQCVSCPLLHPALPTGQPTAGFDAIDLATVTQGHKAHTYRATNLHFVAVSNWLKACALMSSLMRGMDITVIGNAIDTKSYNPVKINDGLWGNLSGKVVVAFGAARIDDPVKGLDLLVATSRYIAAGWPALASRLHILFYGGIRNERALDAIALDHDYVGYVDDPRDVYRRSDIVLSTSEVESFGYTLLEGMACGCVPVTTGGGGQRDIVNHLKDGFVAEPTAASLAQGIGWAADCRIERNSLHRSALRFDARNIAQQYNNLINSLLQ